MRESHLTNFPQAEPEPAQAYERGLGFSFGKPRPRKAELYRRLSGRAEPAQHYPSLAHMDLLVLDVTFFSPSCVFLGRAYRLRCPKLHIDEGLQQGEIWGSGFVFVWGGV